MQRGDVFELLPPTASGREHQGRRYGVVVQSDAFLLRSAVIVAPTSRSARAATFRPQIRVHGEPTLILVEQIGTVDAGRLGDLVGHLTREQLWGVDESLRLVLGLR